MPNDDDQSLLDEAAEIFMALRQNPEDLSLKERKVRFLARGPEERSAFGKVSRAWNASGFSKQKPKKIYAIGLLAVALASLYLSLSPLQMLIYADFRTKEDPQEVVLASGDFAVLDARSAIAEDNSIATRDVQLLKGAAFFDVNQDGRRFAVTIGDVQAVAIGTAFETAWINEEVSVAVFDGVVEVELEERIWRLEQGDRVIFGLEEVIHNQMDLDNIATWRQDRLVADGMTFAQVVSIIERRIPGTIQVVGSEISQARVTGSFDLSQPMSALRNLSAIRKADVWGLPPFLVVIESNP